MLATNQPEATIVQQSDATSPAKEEAEKTESQHIDTDSGTEEHTIATTQVISPVVPTAFNAPTSSKQIEALLENIKDIVSEDANPMPQLCKIKKMTTRKKTRSSL
ncbi:hypothetical protein V6N13_125293 [Hibiscus sabdariffa]